jgi:hypothetical protein
VPVLDVRPVTLGMISTSKDPKCAQNAVSFGNEDGTCFIGARPPVDRTTPVRLRYHIDRVLADGVLYAPEAMEQKWALFHHGSRILCVRSWLRQVEATAEVRVADGWAEVTAVQGVFAAEDEAPAFTERVLDYLLRSHALGQVFPAPLPPGMEQNPGGAALWCMSRFGSLALVATPHPVPGGPPEQPLRTDSLLHIAVARGDTTAAGALLDGGLPVDLLARDGLAPLHWAGAQQGTAVGEFLLARGSPVDVRSAEGATPLMNAVQGRSVPLATWLLERGADPNAADGRGFTSLHRAAEMGLVELVQLLLGRGARPDVEAQGHTPRSLAQGRGETAILELLDRWSPGA